MADRLSPQRERDLENIKKGFAKRLDQVINEIYGSRGGSRFASAVGVPDQTMRPWLAGTTIPSGEKLIAISWVTGKSIDWLLFGKEGSHLTWDEQQWLRLYKDIKGNEKVTKLLYDMIELAREGLLGKK
jgi:hypothetical protein